MEIAEKMQEHTQSLATAKKEAAEAAEAEVSSLRSLVLACAVGLV
jgi:hypothetical protein